MLFEKALQTSAIVFGGYDRNREMVFAIRVTAHVHIAIGNIVRIVVAGESIAANVLRRDAASDAVPFP